MTFELSREDAEFLHAALARHAHEIARELSHTEKQELKRGLAKDLERLQRIATLFEPRGSSTHASF